MKLLKQRIGAVVSEQFAMCNFHLDVDQDDEEDNMKYKLEDKMNDNNILQSDP